MDAIAKSRVLPLIHPLIDVPKAAAMLTICLVRGESFHLNSNALRHILK
ncbi:hypothetical protein ACQR5T_14485 [Xanthomonas oryzae pv. oryzicola]|nr:MULTISPECIES: hypothetical protein [Xanthomonas]MBV7306456.1 hypothetical protein [Xanthomonas vasicola pv. vasculorum]MDO6935775.1 hypothetical protein [Xanthomonas vasicola]MDO6939713.1 hypothetical protein [Xanthomonas vasicola]